MTASMNPVRYEAYKVWLRDLLVTPDDGIGSSKGDRLAPEDAEICIGSLAKFSAAEIFQQLRAQRHFLDWVRQQNAKAIWKGSFAPRQMIGKAKRDGDWVQLPNLKLLYEQQGHDYLSEPAMMLFLAREGYDLKEIKAGQGHSRAVEGYARYKVALPSESVIAV
jgi:hypothetical protein